MIKYRTKYSNITIEVNEYRISLYPLFSNTIELHENSLTFINRCHGDNFFKTYEYNNFIGKGPGHLVKSRLFKIPVKNEVAKAIATIDPMDRLNSYLVLMILNDNRYLALEAISIIEPAPFNDMSTPVEPYIIEAIFKDRKYVRIELDEDYTMSQTTPSVAMRVQCRQDFVVY